MSAQTYQVGAHFKALIKGILMAAMKTLEKFFFISSVSEAQWMPSILFPKNIPQRQINCTIIGFEASGGFVTWFLGHKVAALSLVPKCFISPIDMAIRKTPKLAPSQNSVRRNNKIFAPI